MAPLVVRLLVFPLFGVECWLFCFNYQREKVSEILNFLLLQMMVQGHVDFGITEL